MTKTNALRILESHGVAFDTVEYTVDEDCVPQRHAVVALDAVSVALKIGAEPESVFKTLVARGDKTGLCVFVIPGPFELNLKKAAAASGNKSVELIHLRELTPLTGYVRGGCSPIGMKKPYPTWIDETAQLFDRIYASAGQRGLQMHLAPADLLRVVGAEWADLC